MAALRDYDIDAHRKSTRQHLQDKGIGIAFADSLQHVDPDYVEMDMPEGYLRDGACIHASVAYLTSSVAGPLPSTRGKHTRYIDVLALSGPLEPRRGLPMDGQPGRYLIHCGTTAQPHCFALIVGENAKCIAVDRGKRFELSLRDLIHASFIAADEPNICSFKLTESPKTKPAFAALLLLTAAAGDIDLQGDAGHVQIEPASQGLPSPLLNHMLSTGRNRSVAEAFAAALGDAGEEGVPFISQADVSNAFATATVPCMHASSSMELISKALLGWESFANTVMGTAVAPGHPADPSPRPCQSQSQARQHIGRKAVGPKPVPAPTTAKENTGKVSSSQCSGLPHVIFQECYVSPSH